MKFIKYFAAVLLVTVFQVRPNIQELTNGFRKALSKEELALLQNVLVKFCKVQELKHEILYNLLLDSEQRGAIERELEAVRKQAYSLFASQNNVTQQTIDRMGERVLQLLHAQKIEALKNIIDDLKEQNP